LAKDRNSSYPETVTAIIKSSVRRLRPILTISLALTAGCIPIAIGLNEASAQRTGMGINDRGRESSLSSWRFLYRKKWFLMNQIQGKSQVKRSKDGIDQQGKALHGMGISGSSRSVRILPPQLRWSWETWFRSTRLSPTEMGDWIRPRVLVDTILV